MSLRVTRSNLDFLFCTLLRASFPLLGQWNFQQRSAMNSLREIEDAVTALEWDTMFYITHATLRWLEIDMARFFAKAGFNPGQPRVPRGQSGAGQWTGGGVGSTARTAAPTPGPHGWGNAERLDEHVIKTWQGFRHYFQNGICPTCAGVLPPCPAE